MSWICLIHASSYKPDGKKVIMHRRIEAGRGIESAMLKALSLRKDKGRYFLGEEIVAITPLGQVVRRIYNPDTYQLDPIDPHKEDISMIGNKQTGWEAFKTRQDQIEYWEDMGILNPFETARILEQELGLEEGIKYAVYHKEIAEQTGNLLFEEDFRRAAGILKDKLAALKASCEAGSYDLGILP